MTSMNKTAYEYNTELIIKEIIKSKEEKNTELLNFKLLMYDVGLTKKHFFN